MGAILAGSVAVMAIVAMILGLLSWFVMLLWNGVLVDVMHVEVVTYWQSMGLLLLSSLLFKSTNYNYNK